MLWRQIINNPLSLEQVTSQEVIFTETSLKNKTSFGLDGVSNKVIKLCIEHISKPLARIDTASPRFLKGETLVQ